MTEKKGEKTDTLILPNMKTDLNVYKSIVFEIMPK
jgi:hypothetical protein